MLELGRIIVYHYCLILTYARLSLFSNTFIKITIVEPLNNLVN
jgi:hypothetical protein